MWEWFVDASAWVIPVVLAVTMHEAAHGYVAERFGDDTARRAGRVTFNPFKHVDPFGTVVFPALLMMARSPFIFGYAKPVPVNFRVLRPARLGMALVALAGPATNVALALLAALLLHIEALVTPEEAPWLFMNLYRALMINCVLAVFNMIPILPLDGGRVVDSMLSGTPKALYGKLERWGVLIVLGVLLMPMLAGYNVAEYVIGPPTYWLLETVMQVTGNGG